VGRIQAQSRSAGHADGHFAALSSRPEPNSFRMPLYLQAQESAERVQGNVYALIDLPYREARPALERIDDWCRILILHINVKYCRPSDALRATP
jgi:hypothetical protein